MPGALFAKNERFPVAKREKRHLSCCIVLLSTRNNKKLINGFTRYVYAENLQHDLKIHILHTRQHLFQCTTGRMQVFDLKSLANRIAFSREHSPIFNISLKM